MIKIRLVDFKDVSDINKKYSDSPACIYDTHSGAILGISDITEIYKQIGCLRQIYINNDLRWRAHCLRIVYLPVEQNFIDRLKTYECKKVIHEIL